MTVLFWICAATGLALISGLSEYYRWQYAARLMERIERD